jgi:hypothetical protein
MSGHGLTITIGVLSIGVLASFLFLAVKVGQFMLEGSGHNLGAISALVLLGLVLYIVMAGLLARFLGVTVFDWFSVRPRYEDELA